MALVHIKMADQSDQVDKAQRQNSYLDQICDRGWNGLNRSTQIGHFMASFSLLVDDDESWHLKQMQQILCVKMATRHSVEFFKKRVDEKSIFGCFRDIYAKMAFLGW